MFCTLGLLRQLFQLEIGSVAIAPLTCLSICKFEGVLALASFYTTGQALANAPNAAL